MTSKEFAIVSAAFRIGLEFHNGPFRHQITRLVRHLAEIGDRDQAKKLHMLLDPPPDPYPNAKVVLS